MTILQKILVPTDFSPESINGLTMAVGFAQKVGAIIYLLHIIDVGMPKDTEEVDLSNFDLIDEKSYLTKRLKEVKQKTQQLKNQFSKVEIYEYASFDKITTQINKFVERHGIDLIVMGSQGTSKNENVLLGSNAEKVIRTAQVPVLTVKQAVEEVNIKNVCFASDFKDVPKIAIYMLSLLQNLYGATIHLVKIITPSNFELSSTTHATIKLFAKSCLLENYTINHYNYYTEYEGIIAFATEIKADMISMTTQGNTGFIHVLMGSIAEDVANHSDLPVLTFNEKV